jgi:hypothetical protein
MPKSTGIHGGNASVRRFDRAAHLWQEWAAASIKPKGTSMLNERFLNEFEEYLTSGQLEEDYGYSAEDRKIEILEYLERFMDLAEEADKVATRLLMPHLSEAFPDKTK